MLWEAAYFGNLRMVNDLVAAGADVNDVKALSAAVKQGRMEIVRVLIAAGADVNVRDFDGKTALFHVRDLEIAKVLVAAGADVDVKDVRGATALLYAAHWGYVDVVEVLLAAGADLNVTDIWDMTPIDCSFFSGSLQILEMLLAAGADTENALPLHECCIGRATNYRDLVDVFFAAHRWAGRKTFLSCIFLSGNAA